LVLQEQFHQAEPAVPESVGVLRRAVSDFSRDLGADDAVITSVQLAVSEAISNAIVHAFVEAEPGTVTVSAHPDGDDAICVVVSDDGSGMKPRTDSPGLGIGLPLMTQMTESLEFRENEHGGTDVAMRFALAA
jgi:anti-sigma regulatory factor (Ser/Thr protein kinase)